LGLLRSADTRSAASLGGEGGVLGVTWRVGGVTGAAVTDRRHKWGMGVAVGDLKFEIGVGVGWGYLRGMPRCELCGFGHALPDRCVNCGSTDPFPRRRVIKLVVWVSLVIAAVVFVFYFYGRAKELKLAEARAKAVGQRVFEVGGIKGEGGAEVPQSRDEDRP